MIKRAFQDITNLRSKHIKVTIHKSSHRKKLIRWIYEVCKDFNYSEYTYITAVLIIDRYTEKHVFDLDEYQLIGIASLLIAAKIEEPKTRPISEYASVTDNSFCQLEIVQKEKSILVVLDYNITNKLPQSYLNVDYLKNNFKQYSFEERRELLNCYIAAQLEQSIYTKNMFLLYLQAIREMEKEFKTVVYSEATRFYIKNNPRIDYSSIILNNKL